MDTRTKLVLAAEELFALHGPAGVTTRMIVLKARQKNASALTYYFKTREELIEAICELRMAPINNERIERVAAYLADRPAKSERVRALIEIMCQPALRPITEGKGRSFFRRFLAQAINSPSTGFYDIVRNRYDTGLRQTVSLMREEVPHLDRATADKRIITMIRASSYLSAHLEAQCANGPWSRMEQELKRESQIKVDGFVGFLQAPSTVAPSAKDKNSRPEKPGSDQAWEYVLS